MTSQKLMKAFVIPSGVLRQRSIPGQVPRRDRNIERAGIMKLVEQKPKPWTVERHFDRPFLTIESVVNDLGLSRADANSWALFLRDVLYGSPTEVQMRQQVNERLLQEDWVPELRRAMADRVRALYKYIQTKKSLQVVTVDELKKALTKGEPRGGSYYRRVPTQKGGYRYYYDQEKYQRSKDAHHHGPEAKSRAMAGELVRYLEKAADKGCIPEELRKLAKKYGGKELVAELKKQCGDGGKINFIKGRFYLRAL